MKRVREPAGMIRRRTVYGCVAILATGVAFALVQSLVPPTLAVGVAWKPQDIRITDDGFGYQVKPDGSRRQYRFSELTYVQAQGRQVCYAEDKSQPEIDKSLSTEDARNSIVSSLKDALDIANDKGGRCLPLYWDHKEDASRFASAVDRMIWENSAEIRAQRQQLRQQQLEQTAAAWRAAGSKVEVPEGAQRHLVLAQQAYQEKNPQHMAEELSAALDVYPTWPDQQRNLAIVLGELNRYSEAIQHMQMYLELAPDALDAQRAKQQIWIWQDKEKAGIK